MKRLVDKNFRDDITELRKFEGKFRNRENRKHTRIGNRELVDRSAG
jgi:hypothetical protein